MDAYIPDGALTLEAEQKLLGACTDLLLRHEGVRPGHPAARALAWVFVHRHETCVAGAPAKAPHYKFVCQVPEGQYDEERRAAITRAMTEALVEAEDGRWPSPEARVWVFTFEVPDGTWGGLGPGPLASCQRYFHARAFNPHRWEIVIADGADIGMLDVEYRPGEIYLSRIEVHPDHQGRGVGSRLITALIDEAGQKGQDLVLDVLTVNQRAQALYQRLGMKEVARHGDNDVKITMRSTRQR